MPLFSRKFTCQLCGQSFESGWTDEDAQKEFIETFGTMLAGEEKGTLCDPCYDKFMAWYKFTNHPDNKN